MSLPKVPGADSAPTDLVDAAFAAHPRVGFLPPEQQHLADYDGPLPIGWGQTNSQPRTVAAMLRLLDVQPGMRVLDVGSGSGWSTALLAHMVGPQGQVHGVELVPELVAFGSTNLAATAQPWSSITQATPDLLGLPEQAPFDRILVSAEAEFLPDALLNQLSEGGLMVIPVASEMLRVRRMPGTQPPQITGHGGYRFVPLHMSS